MMKIHEIENKAWIMDGVRIIIRASQDQDLPDYTHQNAAQANWNVSKYLESRIKPITGDKEVTVILGDGKFAHGKKLLISVRESYKK